MSGISQAQTAFSGLGDSISAGTVALGTALGNFATKAADGIVDFGKAAMETGMSFDSSMANVAAISGATAEEIDNLRAKAKEMGATTKFTATEAADAFSYMAMAGWDASQMTSGIAGIMNLAAASGEDLATTSDIVTDALTAFGLKAEDSGHFADVLAAASSAANTNVGLMGETFKYVAPVAGALGYSIEDMATAIGTMANSGIKGSQAGTQLRASLSRLVKPTKEVYAALNALGLVKMADDTGEFAYNMDELSKETAAVDKAQTALNQAIEKYGAGSDQATKKAQKLSEAQAKLAEAMREQKREALEYNSAILDADGNMLSFGDTIAALRQALGGLSEAQQSEYAATIFGQEAMSGMLAIINASDEELQNLSDTVYRASLNMGAIDEAVTNSGVNWEKYSDKMWDVASLVDELAYNFTEAGSSAEEMIGYLNSEYDIDLDDATAAVEAFQAAMAESNGTAQEMADIMNDNLPGSITLMQSAFDGLKTALYEKFSGPLQEMVDVAAGVFSDLTSVVNESGVQAAFASLGDILVDRLGPGVEKLADKFPGVSAAFQDFIGAFSGKVKPEDVDSFAGAIGSIFGSFEEKKTEIITAAKGALDEFIGGLKDGKAGEILSGAAGFFAELFDHFTDDLPDLINRARDSIAEFFGALNGTDKEKTGTVAESLGRIAGAFVEMGKVAFDELSPQISEFIGVLTGQKKADEITTIAGGVADIISTLVSASTEIIAIVTEEVADFLAKCSETGLAEKMAPVVAQVARLLGEFSEGLVYTIENVTGAVFSFIDGAIEKSHLSQAIGGLSEAVGRLLSHFGIDVPGRIDNVKRAVGEFFGSLGGSMIDTFVTPVITGFQKFIEALEKIKSAADNARQAIIDFFNARNNLDKVKITNTNTGETFGLKDVAANAWDAAKNIGKGIKDGLQKASDGMWDFMTSDLDTQVDKVKNKLGMHSPSRVFAGIGKNLVLGMENGWGGEFGDLEKQVDRDLSSLTGTARLAFEDSALGRSSAAGISSMLAAANGSGRSSEPIEINLMLDGDVAASALYDPLRRTAFQKGQHGNMEAAYA